MKKINYSYNIAGTSHNNRNGIIHHLRLVGIQYLMHVRDPKNEYDKNAIKIIARDKTNKCYMLGFIPAKIAKEIAPLMDNGYKVWVDDCKFIGNKKDYISMNLKVTVYKPHEYAYEYEYEYKK